MVWQSAKEMLRKELNDSIYELWIEPLECMSIHADNIQLGCPDRFFSAYIKRNYLNVIQEKIDSVDSRKRKIIVTVGGRGNAAGKIPANTNERQRKQLRLPNIPEGGSSTRSLHPKYTFEEFMVGESNILAQSACRSISLCDDSIGPCLYINSDTGLGKSHLTHAVAHYVLANFPMTRLHYLTAQQFSFEMVTSIKGNTMDGFKKKYHNNCDVLLVEDIHALAGKKKTQEELNELLDVLIKGDKRVIFTANKSPRDLTGIDSELRSRMTSGLITSIQPPDLITRTRIVGKKAEQYNVELDGDLIDYIAQHVQGDVRQIESTLVGVKAKAQLQQGRIDLDLLKDVIASIVGSNRQLSCEMIRDFIAKHYGVPVTDLQSRSRKKAVSFPRQVAMYLCRKHTESSLADIGRQFNRDHSTVMHAIKAVSGKVHRSVAVDEQLTFLSSKLKKL